MLNRIHLLWTLSIAQFLAMQVWFNFSAVMPVVEREWHLSSAQAGIIVAFFHIGYVCAVFFYSFLSDKYNPKYSFVIGALVAGIAGILFAFFVDNFWSAIVLRTISGIGIAGIYVPGMKLLSEIFPASERGKAIGIYVGSLVAGSGFSLFVSGIFIKTIGWENVILVTSLSSILSSIIVYFSPMPKDYVVQSTKLTFSSLKKVIRKQNLLVNLGYSGHCWELYAMWAWIGPFLVFVLDQKGYENAISYGNVIASLVIMIGAFATYLGGKLSDRIGRIRTINLFIICSICCSLIIGWLSFLPLILIICITFIYGFTIIADSPIYNTTITEISDPEVIGISLGVQSVMGFSFTIISPIFFGLLLDNFNWGVAFTVLGLVTILTPICMTLLRNSSTYFTS